MPFSIRTPRHKKIAIATAGLVAVSATLFIIPPLILKPLATQFIRLNGFPDARISSITPMPHGIMIDHISLDGDDFSTVDGINIECSWTDILLHKKIQSLHIKNITLAADLDNSGHYKISGWDAVLPKGSTTNTTLFPIEDVVLQGIVVDLSTSQGDLRIEGKLALNTPSSDKQTMQYSVWAQQKQLSLDLSGTANIEKAGTWSNTLTLNDAHMEFPPFEMSRMSGYFETNHNGTTILHKGHAVAGRINAYDTLWQNIDLKWDSGKAEAMRFALSPSGHPDIKIGGHWTTLPEQALDLTIDSPNIAGLIGLLPKDIGDDTSPDIKTWTKNIAPFHAEFKSNFANIMGGTKKIDATTTLGKGATSITLRTEFKTTSAFDTLNVTLGEGKVPASALSVLLPLKDTQQLELDAGDITMSGTLTVPLKANSPAFNGTAQLTLSDVGGIWKGYSFSKLSGPLKLSSFTPLHFDGAQNITFAISPKDQSLTGQGKVSFTSTNKNALQIKSLTADMAKGHLSVTPFTLPDSADKAAVSDTTITLDKFDIASLLPLITIDGLSGNGTLSGTIPLHITHDAVTLGDAHIETIENGVFAFAPNVYPASLQGDDTRMQTVREALKDFHYTSMSLSMSGPLSGKMTTLLKAEGTNPVFGTRPIHLNLNLEGDVAGAIQKLTGQNAWTAGDIHDKLRSK